MPESLSEEDYVIVPAGKMASPDNPDELIEVWWIQPKAEETVSTTESVERKLEPATAGVR